MSLAEDYCPCRNCGVLTDTGCCSERCADELDQAKRFKARMDAGEIDEDGNELGDYCSWCSEWFAYDGQHSPYCSLECGLYAEKD